MFELLNETLFEKHIAEYLAGSKMYNQRTPNTAVAEASFRTVTLSISFGSI